MQREYRACSDEARLIGVAANLKPGNMALQPGAGQLIGLFIGAGVSAALTPKARSEYVEGCMRGRGYYGLTLSPDEAADLDAQKTADAGAAWVERFYGRADFEQRLALASAPEVTALPQLKPEPMTFGAIRFDPSLLAVANGVVGLGKPVLTGRIAYRQTALVKSDVSAFPAHIVHGSLAYAVVWSQDGRPANTYWCGRMKMGMIGGGSGQNYCVWIGKDGYVFDLMAGAPGLVNNHHFYSTLAKRALSNYALDENSTGSSEPMDFALFIKKISQGGLSLIADATLNGRPEQFWSADVLFDEQGKAVLPFWTHRLTFTHSGDGVTVAFTADGDGRGWEAIKDTSPN